MCVRNYHQVKVISVYMLIFTHISHNKIHERQEEYYLLQGEQFRKEEKKDFDMKK